MNIVVALFIGFFAGFCLGNAFHGFLRDGFPGWMEVWCEILRGLRW